MVPLRSAHAATAPLLGSSVALLALELLSPGLACKFPRPCSLLPSACLLCPVNEAKQTLMISARMMASQPVCAVLTSSGQQAAVPALQERFCRHQRPWPSFRGKSTYPDSRTAYDVACLWRGAEAPVPLEIRGTVAKSSSKGKASGAEGSGTTQQLQLAAEATLLHAQ